MRYAYKIKMAYSTENEKEYLFKDWETAKRNFEALANNPLASVRIYENKNYGTDQKEKWGKISSWD